MLSGTEEFCDAIEASLNITVVRQHERHMPCARRKNRTLCEHKTLHYLLSNTMMHSTSLMPVRQLLFIYCKAGPDPASYMVCIMHHGPVDVSLPS